MTGNHRWNRAPGGASTCQRCGCELRGVARRNGSTMVHTHEWRMPGGEWRQGARPLCPGAPTQLELGRVLS